MLHCRFSGKSYMIDVNILQIQLRINSQGMGKHLKKMSALKHHRLVMNNSKEMCVRGSSLNPAEHIVA